MSLKEETKEIFQHYGLTDAEIEAYMVFLSYPQFTVSEVAGVLEKEEHLAQIQQIAVKLEGLGFIKKIPGVVDRYVPCEPYLELFTKESNRFRVDINKTKDDSLTDQSSRFDNLESIENQAKEAIDSTVNNQIGDIFRETDTKDVHKKELLVNSSDRFKDTSEKLSEQIRTDTFEARDKFEEDRTNFTTDVKTKTESARDRFSSTAEQLQNSLQTALFHVRDRFTETTQTMENTIEQRLNEGRDRNAATTKGLETHLHDHLNARKDELHLTVEAKIKDTAALWDSHAEKFKSENSNLNGTLNQFSGDYTNQTKAYESQIHASIDQLNQSLKNIANQFKDTYQSGVQTEKQQMNKIMDDLLSDFTDRVSNLEIECKKSLDDYVAYHKENAGNLKPELDEILEKNIIRMKEVIDSLKSEFSGLLSDQVNTFAKNNDDYRNAVSERVETRHSQLAGQVLEFKKNTVELIDNLKDTSDRYTELARLLAKRGSAWKSLLFGTHKKFTANYDEIKERIGKLSGDMKKNFEDSTAMYIQETGKTSTDLNADISKIVDDGKLKVKEDAIALDNKQKENLDATLDGIAQELAKASDATITKNVQGIVDTNVKLKDMLESSFKNHHDDFDLHLNKHRQSVLEFDDERNKYTRETVDNWYKDMDQSHNLKKTELSTKVADHLRTVQDHLTKTTTKNDNHSGMFERAVMDTKVKQQQIFTDLLKTADDDFNNCKQKSSQDIDTEIKTITTEIADMNAHQRSVMDAQIKLVTDEIAAKNQEQIDALKAQIALFQQEVGEINELQQNQVNDHIEKFKETIQVLDVKQTSGLKAQIEYFSRESSELEQGLHAMFEKHKADFDQNTKNLQTSLTKTIETNIQDTKDAIADFTLTFMNAIDEMNDKAEDNENVLENINQAAKSVRALGSSSTWHVFGMKALLEAIVASLTRAKSTITIISPQVEPKILEALSQVAFTKKSVRFLYTTNWDMSTYGQIVEKMKQLGNLQFRNLKSNNDFYAVSRDGEEIILCPKAPKKEDLISIISTQEGYAQIFGSFIYPMFQANSRPI